MQGQDFTAGGHIIMAAAGANISIGSGSRRDKGTGPPERLAHIRFFPLGEKFAGRKPLLDDLAARLQPGKAAALSQRAAIHADGGVGKTALAVELAWRLFNDGQFPFVFLLDATSVTTIDGDLAALCRADWLNLPEQREKEPLIQLDAVKRWLKTSANAERTLLVFDGADSDDARAKVREHHTLLPHCAMLITTRHSIGGGIKEFELELFSKQEAREFLRTHLDAAFLQAPDADATLDGIADAVDHLPLALEIVASYIHETHQPPQAWLREWQQTPEDTLEFHNPEQVQYPRSLSRVWEQSVARLSDGALQHLHALAWLAPRPAGLPMKALREQEKWNEIRALFVELAKASLIQWPQETDEVTIHRVLQAVMRHRMKEEEKAASRQLVVGILNAAIPDPEWSEPGWQLWERLQPHMRAVLATIKGTNQEKAAAWLMGQYGYWLRQRAQHAEAESLYRRALELDEESLGHDHPEVAIRLNNLALLLQDTNQLSEAEPLMRLALEILLLFSVRTGFEHPHSKVVRGNYILLVKKLGWSDERVAEELKKVEQEARQRVGVGEK